MQPFGFVNRHINVVVYICNVMLAVRKILFFGFLLLFLSSAAKNKKDIDVNSKKEFIQENLKGQFASSETLFEKNNGQYKADFTYRYNNPNACVDFYDNRIVFSLRKLTREHNPHVIEESMQFDYVVWEIQLEESQSTEITSLNLHTITNVNYFDINGQRIKKEVADEVIYPEIYPNIDLRFYKSDKGELKYDFILRPGAHLSDIKLKYDGIENMEVLQTGELQYQTKWGLMKEEKPFSFLKSSNKEVVINYFADNNTLLFKSSINEITETTILDPIYVDWSTYFYGSGNNGTSWAYTWVYDLDIDDDDNVYIAGITNDRFPGITNSYDTSTNGYYDAFICKMAPDGDSIIWFSYLGGSSYEYCFTVTVNSQQEPVVSGFTWSSDFPTTPGAFDRTPKVSGGGYYQYLGYVTKFAKNGDSLVFSTFLGGNGSDLIHSMTLDASNNIYITGETRSTDFPVTAGCFQSTYAGNGSGGYYWNGGDAFLTKMNPTGTSLIFSTYVGGYEADAAYEVALSPSQDIYIVGKTASGNFPVTAGSPIFNYNVLGANDGFICKFKPDGKSMLYSKMMGGTGEDWFEGVYVNKADEAYVAGISKSSNFYTTSKAYQKTSAGGADVVVVKFNALGQNVVYSTYLGGSGEELYYSGFIYNSNVRIAANVREEAIICGISRSSNFPVTSDALMATNPSSSAAGFWNSSATISKLDFRGEKLLYATYFGGSSYEVPGANKLKRISCYTNILYGGFTSSSDYPTTTGVYKENKSTSTSGYYWTGFVSKFRDTLRTELIDLSLEDSVIQCDKIYKIFDTKNKGADILWSNGSTRQYEVIQDTGQFWVQATYGCDTVRDTITIFLEHSPTVPILPSDTTYCDSIPVLTLDAKNDTIKATYLWSTSDTTQTINVNQEGSYQVEIFTPNCGSKKDTIILIERFTPNPTFPDDSIFCDDISLILIAGDTLNDETYKWNNQDSVFSITVSDTGYYKVVVANVCGSDSTDIRIDLLKSPIAILPNDSVFCNSISYPIQLGNNDNDEYYFVNDLNQAFTVFTTDTFTITSPSTYEAVVTNLCGASSDTMTIGLIETPSISLGNDSTFCDVVYLPLSVGKADNEEDYTWDDGSDASSRLLVFDGLFWVEAENKCGLSRDSISISLVETPTATLPSDSVFCDNVNMLLDAEIAESTSSYKWQDDQTTPSITATTPGKYKVTISNYCGSSTDSMLIGLIESPVVDLGDDEIFCGAVKSIDYTVGKSNNEEDYLWSNGSTASSTTLFTVAKHWVQIANKCATVSDSISFIVSPNPIVDLGPDTTLCGNFALKLDAGNPGMSYVWEPYGETTQIIEAREQRIYKVTVYNENGCEGSDEFEVDGGCVSHYYIPTAFSPNADGVNDVFKPSLINFEDYEMAIFTRWGEKLFETTNINEGWDGTYKGETVQNGVYLYQIRFKTTEDLRFQNMGGILNVIR